MLDVSNDMLDVSNDMLDVSNDMLDRSNDMLDRSNDMLDRSNEIFAMLAKNLKKYFLDEDSLVASYEWISDLFQDTPEELSTSEEEILIYFTSSEKLKGNL
ncbi:hypothetical protein TNCV_2407971 [Trichonephila clavipes]|nr:hypothetical protein TNCV_2407971 [Trichonephila clavipes]